MINKCTEEIWKDIEGYEGLYQVSTLGRIKSLSRMRRTGIKCGKYMTKEKILVQSKCCNGNYLQVNLSIDGKTKQYLVHRLVGLAFVDGYSENKEIDHINCDKRDNRYFNLRWTNRSENMRNPITYAKTLKHHKEVQSKCVFQYDHNYNLIKIWESTRECGRNGYAQSSVASCCRKEMNAHKGYIWSYERL